MIEITNGLIKLKVPKRDLKTYISLGYKQISQPVVKKPKTKDDKNTTNSNSK